MISTLRNVSAAAFALTLLAAPVFAAQMGGGDASGSANASGDANANSTTPNVMPDAAGQNGVPGTKSVTGANTDYGASTMSKSQAELPNNDAGTSMHNGPADKVGEPRQLVPGNAAGGMKGTGNEN